MLKLDTRDESIYNSLVYRVAVPEGTMFVILMETSDGKLVGIDINIGHAGTTLRAWSHSFARLMTMLLEKGCSIFELIEELSLQSSDKSIMLKNGGSVSSGPEGIAQVLYSYNREKHQSYDIETRSTDRLRNRRRA